MKNYKMKEKPKSEGGNSKMKNVMPQDNMKEGYKNCSRDLSETPKHPYKVLHGNRAR